MTLNIGVIGVGMIGQDHIRRLTTVLAGSTVTAVSDVDTARAQRVADELPAARAFAAGSDLVDDDSVDAVVVTSWGPTHEEYVLACVAAGAQTSSTRPIRLVVPFGPGGVFPACGTGEFHALSIEEVRTVVTAAVEVVAGKVPVVAGAGGPLGHALAAAKAAEAIGS